MKIGPEDKLVGAILRRHRMAAGLSMLQVGDAIGVAYQQVQKYESGKNRVAIVTLMRLADALNVPLSDLVREIEVAIRASASFCEVAERPSPDPTSPLFSAASLRSSRTATRAKKPSASKSKTSNPS